MFLLRVILSRSLEMVLSMSVEPPTVYSKPCSLLDILAPLCTTSRNLQILLLMSYLRIVISSFYGHDLRGTGRALMETRFLLMLAVERVG